MDGEKTADRLDTDLLLTWRKTNCMQQQQIKITVANQDSIALELYPNTIKINIQRYPKNIYTATQNTKEKFPTKLYSFQRCLLIKSELFCY